MKVDRIYINTHKYDFNWAKICIASIRYWYPKIPIFLIKDHGSGPFSTKTVEKIFNVKIFKTQKMKFGWGFGKLEPLFEESSHTFLVLDADTVLTGPVLDVIINIKADFIVDLEVQPIERFNQIYYNLDRIKEINAAFVYPGYSFNTGQWFGSTGHLKRDDFAETLDWSEPPRNKYPGLLFDGDQGQLNYLLHWKEQQGLITIERKKIMVWPEGRAADFIPISSIENRLAAYPFIIHWAGMKDSKKRKLPRKDILAFYKNYYSSHLKFNNKFSDIRFEIYQKMELIFMKVKMKLIKP